MPHPITHQKAIPPDLITLFNKMALIWMEGGEAFETLGEYYGACSGGVIFLRRDDLAKWPEHDKYPKKPKKPMPKDPL